VSDPTHAIVGIVRNAQGIRGEVVIEPLTDRPDAIFAPGRRVFVGDREGIVKDERADALTVESSRPFKGGLMVSFEEIADRNAADLLRGRFVLAPFDELEPPGEDEVYLHELIGMSVALDSGERIGTVESLYELPQGLTLDVRTDKGSVLVPYRPELIERTDQEARVVTVKSDTGLFDLG
jgi:16S rRNA processing protein RimM